MVDYRNILRLQSQGHSQREIERELYCSRHTISEVLIRAKAAGIVWPLEDDVTNEDIQEQRYRDSDVRPAAAPPWCTWCLLESFPGVPPQERVV